MSKEIYVKPAREGLVVRDVVTGQSLPAEGASVPRSSYWMRRLRDGDVVEAKPPKKKSAPKPQGDTPESEE